MPEEFYDWAEQTLHRLELAGISVQAVMDVLYGEPVVRRHIGSVLQLARPDRDGNWLAVALIEGADDRYTVTGARYLDDDEVANLSRYLEE